MSESANHIVEGRRVEQCFYTRTWYGKCYHRQARCVTRFRWRASRITIRTANGFSVINSCLSKRSYPTCLCVTAFQLVHFQIAYHSSWWSYITHSYEMGSVAADGDLTSSTATGRNSRLQQHIVWQCMGETPCNIDYNQSAMWRMWHSWLIVYSSSNADNCKCCTCSMYWSFKFLFHDRFSHALFLIGQHTLHKLLTAIRVMDYNMMYGGPNLTRGASKC